MPIPLQQALGVTTVQYREFGTRIDFVPIVLGNGIVRLEVRPEITEIDPSLRDTVTGVPGFRSRTADTAVEMQAGQTLAIAGLVYNREDAVEPRHSVACRYAVVRRAVPPRVERRNEVELLIFVTPEFCEAMDPNEVPPCGPGQLTTPPTDCELYFRGYIEVPEELQRPQLRPRHGPRPGMMGPACSAPMATRCCRTRLRRAAAAGLPAPAARPRPRSTQPHDRHRRCHSCRHAKPSKTSHRKIAIARRTRAAPGKNRLPCCGRP